MTAIFLISPRAQADLDEIWDYTLAQWGENQTERYFRELWHGITCIADQPQLGRACDEIRAGYYKFPVGSHIVFYRLTMGGIDIIRILHGRMDFERHL